MGAFARSSPIGTWRRAAPLTDDADRGQLPPAWRTQCGSDVGSSASPGHVDANLGRRDDFVTRLADELEPVLLGHTATGDVRRVVVDLDVIDVFDAERHLGQLGHCSRGDALTALVPADPVPDLETCGTMRPWRPRPPRRSPLSSVIA